MQHLFCLFNISLFNSETLTLVLTCFVVMWSFIMDVVWGWEWWPQYWCCYLWWIECFLRYFNSLKHIYSLYFENSNKLADGNVTLQYYPNLLKEISFSWRCIVFCFTIFIISFILPCIFALGMYSVCVNHARADKTEYYFFIINIILFFHYRASRN